MDTPLTDRLLAELRGEMARQRITQAMLAEATDMTTSGVSRRLSGRSPITLTEADQIARALGTDLLVLMQRTATGAGAA